MFFHFLALILLAGCAQTPAWTGIPQETTPAPAVVSPFPSAASATGAGTPMASATGVYTPGSAGALSEPVKVAMLVPQTGNGATTGQALLQAAQLAVFDLNEPQFQLVPKDTKGTPEGAREAVQEAAKDGVKLILGPLFAQGVEAAKTAARGYGLTVIGFSTDWRVAGDNAYLMGVLPFGQAERIADYAARQSLRRIVIVAPRDLYGDAVTSAFEQTARRYGMSIVRTIRLAANGSDAMAAITQLTSAKGQFDALFMPIGGQTIHMLAATLKSYGLGSADVRYLGTGLWEEASILSDPNMAGALYAAPSPQGRAGFEHNYTRIYGSVPPRLASIGYDATALAIVLARNAAQARNRVSYDRASLTNPNGFSGVDGIFRFGSSGLAERGMAVLQIGGGRGNVVEPAPNSFLDTAR